MIDIDFNFLYPSTEYFVSVNMMFEFTSSGQVIPTRIDVLPYKLNSFATHGNPHAGNIDILKFILVLYTFYCVFLNYQSYSLSKVLSIGAILENGLDLTIIFLQTYPFMLKISDSDSFNVIPNELLEPG